MFRLTIYPERCSGCRSCEIACSYHHKKVFSRKMSSIYIRRKERKGEFEIIISRDGIKERPVCDLCYSKEEPLCVRFCKMKALCLEEV